MAQQRVAVLDEPERMHVETREIPEPGPGEVQVAVRAVSVCGSDVHYYDHGRIGGFVMHAPLVLGHETSGVISAVGPGTLGPGGRDAGRGRAAEQLRPVRAVPARAIPPLPVDRVLRDAPGRRLVRRVHRRPRGAGAPGARRALRRGGGAD